LALLKAHYRSELMWSEQLLKESKKNLDDWYRTFVYPKSASTDCLSEVDFSTSLGMDMSVSRLFEMLFLTFKVCLEIIMLQRCIIEGKMRFV